MLNKSGIYKITCVPTGKFYIGSAVWFRDRWNTHRSAARGNRHHSKYLQNSWNKYGENSFEFEILLVCAKEDVIVYEQKVIDALKPEFNTLPVAGSPLGYKHTAEACKNMSRAKLLVSKKGLPGREWSAEQRKRMSEKCKGEGNHRYGVSPSIESRRRHSETMIGYKHSSETIAKYSAASKRKWEDPAYRAQMSTVMKGRKVSPEVALNNAKLNGIRVTIGEVEHHSMKSAARMVGRHESTLMAWAAKGVVPAGNGEFSGLSIVRDSRRRPELSRTATTPKTSNPLQVGDMKFSSRKSASNFFGVCVTTITRWVEVGAVLKPRNHRSYMNCVGVPVVAAV